MEVVLKRDKIGGLDTLITADKYGDFTVYVDDGTVSIGDTITYDAKRELTKLAYGKSLNDAVDRAKTAAAKRRVRVQIPFISREAEHGIATGIHAGTGAVLANIGGMNGVQLSGSADTKVFPGDSDPALVEEYVAEREKIKLAERRCSEIEREHMIRLPDVIGEAIDAKLAEQNERDAAAEPAGAGEAHRVGG